MQALRIWPITSAVEDEFVLENVNCDHYTYNEIKSLKDAMSKKFDLDSMSVDEMWQLHEQLSQMLSARLVSEKRELEKRLARLRIETKSRGAERASEDRPHRKYPPVFPKYRNSNPPYETWSGRGKQPRWLTAALKAGRTTEEFAIGKAQSSKHSGRRRRP